MDELHGYFFLKEKKTLQAIIKMIYLIKRTSVLNLFFSRNPITLQK